MRKHFMLIFPLIMIAIPFAGIVLSELNGLDQNQITLMAALCVLIGFVACFAIAKTQVKDGGQTSRAHKLVCNALAESVGDKKPFPDVQDRRRPIRHEFDKTCG